VTSLPGQASPRDIADGVLGLGFVAGNANRLAPPFYNALDRGLFVEPVHAFYFSQANHEHFDVRSEVVFGGVNSVHYTGETTTLPLRHEARWAVSLDGVALGGASAESENTSAILSTDTPLIFLPTASAERL
jgi:saccharopepsin